MLMMPKHGHCKRGLGWICHRTTFPCPQSIIMSAPEDRSQLLMCAVMLVSLKTLYVLQIERTQKS